MYFDSKGLHLEKIAIGLVVLCAKNKSCSKKVKDACEGISARAARRKAMRERNVPTSRPTTSQKQNKRDGTRQDTVKDSSGNDSVQTHHKADKKHASDHVHSSTPKRDPITGDVRVNQHGDVKYQSGGSTVNY